MEYYAPTHRAPSTFHRPEASVRDPNTGAVLSLLPRREEWHLQHAGPSTPSATVEKGLGEAMWRMTLQPQEEMETSRGPYPVRPGEVDCAYYMRTGLCGFGTSCRFNHPPDRRLAQAGVRGQGEYPERIGQPECQYYLKTGTCKFGTTCKFHHPRDKAGYLGQAQLNVLNLPLRPGEKDCAYYMRTGACKFGATCKFNHPQPTAVGTLISPLFPPGAEQSGSAPAHQPYRAGLPTWQIARGAYLPSPRMQGPSGFAPVLFPPPRSLVSMWNTYQGPVGPPLASPDGQQQALGASYFYGAAAQQEPVAGSLHATFSPYMQASGGASPSGTGRRDSSYPSRPGQPECHYYMKTGECKFGSTCKFHHPRDRSTPSTALAFSPMGLPLRPGVPPCTFYTRHGFCKYGPTCKFDHPFLGLPSSPSASSLADMPAVPFSAGSPPTILAPTLSSEITILRQPTRTTPSSDTASSSGTQARHRHASSRDSMEENGSFAAAQTGKDACRGRSPSPAPPLSAGSKS